MQQQGVLVVGSRYAPTVYYQGADGPDGFEYAMAKLFAEHLGVGLRFVFPPNLDALFDATASGTVHMAAAGLTITPAREQQVRFSIPYEQITEQVVYRRNVTLPYGKFTVEHDDEGNGSIVMRHTVPANQINAEKLHDIIMVMSREADNLEFEITHSDII